MCACRAPCVELAHTTRRQHTLTSDVVHASALQGSASGSFSSLRALASQAARLLASVLHRHRALALASGASRAARAAAGHMAGQIACGFFDRARVDTDYDRDACGAAALESVDAQSCNSGARTLSPLSFN